jgi:L-fuconolactonase
MRIDSHQHFWQVSRGDYYWMTPSVPVLYRDYMPEDLNPHLEKNRIDKTILVQAAPTVAETDFLLTIAQKQNFVAGVTGWLDMDSEHFLTQLTLYSGFPKFVALRPMLQDLPEDGWILRPRVLQSLREVAARDFPFEILTYTRQLPYVLKALDHVPNLRAVVNHLSKPEIKERKMEPWKSLLREVAQHPNVYCKLSGMITEADQLNWKPDDLRPYVETVLEAFGLDRVMFGSDWPVCLCAGSYDQALEALTDILAPHLDEASATAAFGDNAAHFYKLSPGGAKSEKKPSV